MNIVICEDCPTRADSIAERLARDGHVVTGIFHSDEDCLARCAHLPPDAVALGPGMALSRAARPLTSAIQALGLTVMVVPDPTRCPDSPHLGAVRDDRIQKVG